MAKPKPLPGRSLRSTSSLQAIQRLIPVYLPPARPENYKSLSENDLVAAHRLASFLHTYVQPICRLSLDGRSKNYEE